MAPMTMLRLVGALTVLPLVSQGVVVVEVPSSGAPRLITGAHIPSSPRGFLLSRALGPYTVIRTVDGEPSMLGFHAARLVHSASAATKIEAAAAPAPAVTATSDVPTDGSPGPEPESPILLNEVADKLERGTALMMTAATAGRASGELGELLLTVLLEPSDSRLWLHASPAPPSQPPTLANAVKVAVAGPEARRTAPTAKHSSWILDRQAVEQARPSDCYETLLTCTPDAEGDIQLGVLEGSVTNFFVLEAGKVLRTAPETSVLPGSVRRAVLCAARALGYDIEFTAPSLKDCMKWKAAFLTGSGRVVSRVGMLVWDDCNRSRRGSGQEQIAALEKPGSAEADKDLTVLWETTLRLMAGGCGVSKIL